MNQRKIVKNVIALLFFIALVMQTIGSNATLAYASSIATGRLEIGDQVGLSGGVATFANGTTIKIYTGASADTANTEITMDRENGDNHTVETNEFDDALFVKVVVDVPFGEGVSTPSINWAGSAEVWDVTPDGSISGIYEYTKQIDFSHNSICRINISFESNNGHGSQGEPQELAWFDKANKYLAPGINIMSHHVGDEEGTITYEFSDDKVNWTDAKTLNRAQIDSAIDTLSQNNPDAGELAKAKSTLIGIGNGYPKRYVRIKVAGELTGDHLGVEVFTKNAQGSFNRNDNKEAKFWSYEKNEWVSFNGIDRSFEEYLKQAEIGGNSGKHYEGMILDLSGLDADNDAIKVILPFDSRMSIGWWNGSYKEKVVEAEKGNEGFDPDRIDWLYNGNVYLVNVVGKDGKVYYSDAPGWTPDSDLNENYQVVVGKPGYDRGLRPGYDGQKGKYSAAEMLDAANNAGVNCMIPKGATVTVKMVPDAGYQLLRAEINDSPIVPDNGTTSQFSFVVQNNMGITGIFEKTPDIVDVSDANQVSGIELGHVEDAISSGNLAVTVSDDKSFDTSKATKVVEGTPVTAVDIEVDNVIAKGGELSEEEQKQAKSGTLKATKDNYWTENMPELDSNIDITMTLDNVTVGEGESIAIVREHNGVCEKIHATVKTDGEKTLVTFASNKFSTYTIIKTGETAPCEHAYGKAVVTKATATKDGSSITKCTKCGDEKKEVIYAAKNITLAKAEYTYDGKVKKPAVTVKDSKGKKIASSNYTVTYAKGRKAIGEYKVTIKFTGDYSGSKTLKFKIVPKTTTVSKVTPGSKKLAVSVKKVTSNVNGYEIQIATDSKFTKGVKKVTLTKNTKTSATFKSLKKGAKYYVRVRTYKTVGKTKIYSGWKKYSKQVKIE